VTQHSQHSKRHFERATLISTTIDRQTIRALTAAASDVSDNSSRSGLAASWTPTNHRQDK